MRRREVIALMAAWPLAARAQQVGKIARIGFLGAASASGYAQQIEGFRLGLRELGYIEDTNVVIIYRWAEDSLQRGRDCDAWKRQQSSPSNRRR
jgi:putative tryptophan/tyrosine transport system substrate-binding protein